MSATLAVIGGTGLYQLEGAVVQGEVHRETPYGTPSGRVTRLEWQGREVLFLGRHGVPHRIPPHRINYRANLWLLAELGVREVLAINAVGGIAPDCPAGSLVLVDQVVDYTWGREHTYYDGADDRLEHVEFGAPYSARLRQVVVDAARRLGQPLVARGVYGATQGPRLESAAEIRRMARDGCDVVGMTGMPEVALARELELEYACLCLVVNPAAGCSDEPITMAEINAVLAQGMGRVTSLIGAAVAAL